MAKIAVELEQALVQRAANGEPGRMTARVLSQGDRWHVADVVCTCGPHDKPFEEEHAYATVAVVLAGSFQYRGALTRRGTRQDLMTPGSLLLGNAGQCFECGHEHALGDRCLSFRYGQDYFERLAADAGMSPEQRNFRVNRLPPVRPLSRAIARACARLVRDAGASWEELGLQLAAEALVFAHGRLPGTMSMPASSIARVTRAVRMIDLHDDVAPGNPGTGIGTKPVSLPTHVSASDWRNAASICAESAPSQGRSTISLGAGEGPGHCPRLRFWRCVELQSLVPS